MNEVAFRKTDTKTEVIKITLIKELLDWINEGMRRADSCEEYEIYKLIYNKGKELAKKDLEEFDNDDLFASCVGYGTDCKKDLEEVVK